MELTIINKNNQLLVDSREVAEMVEKQHSHLMRDIKGYIDVISANPNLDSLNFFVESSYFDTQNKERPCYLLTKQGCEMVANKMTGQKGILFTAAYVSKFNAMEETIHNKALESTDDSIARRLRAEAMDRNSRTKQAQLISKFADKVSPVAHDLLLVHATELMLQKQIEYKPEIRPTYSAEQIGKQLGISANKVGRLANAHGLKTEQYGLTVLSKSKHSVKQVPTFVYYKEVIPVLRGLLDKE